MSPDETGYAGPNWYDVLDVDQSASTDEIRDAWRAAIADLTPADRRFRLYNQAAEVLLDPARRAAHDAELAPQHDAAEQEQVDEAEEVAPRGAEVAPAPAPTGRGVPTWLLAVLAVAAVVALGVTAYLWTQPSEDAAEEAASEARSAAERAVVPLLSYDFETLEQDRAEAEELMTPDYQEKYDGLFSVIEENAPRTETVVDVDVVASAVVRSGEDEDRWDILLFVDRPTTNKATEEPVVFKDQATLTMQRVDGEWLVDGLQTSPAQQ